MELTVYTLEKVSGAAIGQQVPGRLPYFLHE
jgi:hypothetical protein